MNYPKLPSFRLDGKKALVTGAGRGIGMGASIALAESGANVTLVSRTEKELKDLEFRREQMRLEHELAEVEERSSARSRTSRASINKHEKSLGLDPTVASEPARLGTGGIGTGNARGSEQHSGYDPSRTTSNRCGRED